MAKVAAFVTLGGITLDQTSPLPLYRQLYTALRQAILSGQLGPGTRLPSTRALALELSVSRNTVVNAFEQLSAEGYLESKIGSGTRVTRQLPDALLQVRSETVDRRNKPSERRMALSKRGMLIAGTPVSQTSGGSQVRAFRTGLPALDAFPKKIWSRLATRWSRNLPNDLMGYSDPAGYRPLREAIAVYLSAARGVRCEPDQVIIVSGAQQAIDLTARLLLDSGDTAWVEEPGYLGAKGALLAAGVSLTPVPVDQQGLNVEVGIARSPQARLAYISPSHQYPLGVTMSLARRLALLQWANQADAWVIEDDYDSEYRYGGHPLASLQGLDSAGRVIYIGTLSKVLFPALRLGYLVVPAALVDAFIAARALVDRCSSTLEQAALADFINEGHFARHIRRMRGLYAGRRAALIETATDRLAGLLEIKAAEAGLHLVGWLPEGMADEKASQQLMTHQVESLPLSSFAMNTLPRGGLVLGYAAVDVEAIHQGVDKMEKVLGKLKSVISRQSSVI